MSENAPHEIVIIKRVSGGHEDEHHGGVWKIAFADFMTAMMAFFLVMWLISANDKTKAVIARYFNPVLLVDSTPQPKGLEDLKPGTPSVTPKMGSGAESKKDDKADAAKPAGRTAEDGKDAQRHEDALFRDPYAVLAEIADKSDAQPLRDKTRALQDGVKGGSGAVGLKPGTAFRDPFEPLAAPMTGSDAPSFDRAPGSAAVPVDTAPARDPVSTADTAAKTQTPQIADTGEATTLAGRLEAALASQGKSSGSVPTIEVKQTSEGTLIDLTDGSSFSMFSAASAEPSAKTVALMEKIGRVLKAEKGRITIRGFTDNKPFRSDSYDNWRLSAARAHMAHYMLVRGGIDDQRFERIEGLADRKPKNPKDPGAPENRRIEILLEATTP